MDNRQFLVVALLVFVTVNLLIISSIYSAPVKIKIVPDKITGRAINGSSYASLTIIAIPIIVDIEKDILTSTVDVGDEVLFNISIRNNGYSNVTEILINDTFNPVFLSYSSEFGPLAESPQSSGTGYVFYNISTNLAPGYITWFVINFTALSEGSTINNLNITVTDEFNETEYFNESSDPFTIGPAVKPPRRIEDEGGGGGTARRTIRGDLIPEEPPEEEPTPAPKPPVEEKPAPTEIPPIKEKPTLIGGGNLTNMTFMQKLVYPYSTLRNFLILLAAIILTLIPILLREKTLIFMDEAILKSLIAAKKVDKYKEIHVTEEVYHMHMHLKNLKPLLLEEEDKLKIDQLLSKFHITNELATLMYFASKSKKKCKILTEHRLFTEMQKAFRNVKFYHSLEEEKSIKSKLK